MSTARGQKPNVTAADWCLTTPSRFRVLTSDGVRVVTVNFTFLDNRNLTHNLGQFRVFQSATQSGPRGQHRGVHELSLCQAIAGVVKPHAHGRRIDVVRVQVGALRQVVPESLEFCWSLVRDYEDLGGAELELELVPAEVKCRSCQQHSQIESRWSVLCPHCANADVEVVRGNEFLVTSLDVT